ncbi:ferritin-like fold-containing protein [Actinomycetospora termitidis]|uniref:Ferritin-like fold-containing protein n=1 Tax=Actinomycetospora termitidis TaxID=3053470 RepID=A0ABT7M9I2_9PSEU|nr:ferritin-like fold-containing protein [Actinomycetospora sp. Odt1-22]MDL5157310.1 ferritin-like fold-containing protein [Actinomycetospora sp. Odt1-22]
MTEAGGQDEFRALLGLVAYGELAAFTQLAADAQLAPDLAGRADLATLAAVEMDHFRRVRDHLAARGVDVLEAMAPFTERVDRVLRTVAGRDWAEALVATTLGRGLVTDLQAEALEGLSGADAELVGEVIADVGHDAFVAARVREACGDPQVHARLSMWARRLLGEALAAVTAALDEDPGLAAVLAEGAGSTRSPVLKRLKTAHNRRVAALGL